jgi:serine/threonine protein kinase
MDRPDDDYADELIREIIPSACGDVLIRNREEFLAEMLRECLISSRLVKINFEKELGEGGFGKVYLGEYENNRVAVKKLEKRKEFQAIHNEIILLRYLSHPNILQLYGYYEQDNCIFILMEVAPLGSLTSILHDHVNHPDIPFPRQLSWLLDMISGIKFIHSKRIKHRDIKPDNYLVFADYKLKLSDFGLSKKSLANMSTTNSVVGTLNFMAPEILNGEGAAFSSDIFSFALSACYIFRRKLHAVLPYTESARMMICDSALECISIKDEYIIQPLREMLFRCLQYREGANQDFIRPTPEQIQQILFDLLHPQPPVPPPVPGMSFPILL